MVCDKFECAAASSLTKDCMRSAGVRPAFHTRNAGKVWQFGFLNPTMPLRKARGIRSTLLVVPNCPHFLDVPTDLIMRTVRKPSLSEKEIMRINRKMLTLIIASLCGTGSSAIAVGQDYDSRSPLSSVGRIGDGGVAAPSTADPADTLDSRPAAFRSNTVSDPAAYAAAPAGGGYDTPTYSMASYAMPGSEGSSCSDLSCGSTSFAGGCNTGCGSVGCSNGWLESETLLWWAKGIQGAPLVVGGNSPTILPTTALAGGPDNPIGNSLLVGMRLNVGTWLDCNQNFGVGARGFGLLSGGGTQTYTNGGNSTGVPFFNTTLGQPDTYLVNFNAGGGLGANTGTIQIKNDVDLIAGELYGRALLARQGSSRVDLLGGYTFVRLDSELGVRTEYTDGITNTIQNGTVITTQDTFGTKNQFHGGHIGLLNEVSAGRFTFSALGKIALGNMEQKTTVSGSYREAINGAVVNDARGLFAQRSNIGTITRNQFTFLPEAGAKMKYQLGRAQLGVGYTLLLFPSVAMASDQIDRNIDIGGIAGTPIAPGPKFTTDSFFLHGLDLGMTVKF